MSKVLGVDAIEGKTYSEQVLARVLADLIPRIGESEDSDFQGIVEPLIREFKEFQAEWEKTAAAFLESPAEAVLLAAQLSGQAAASEMKTKTVKHGPFVASVRLPGQPNGACAGRAPKLVWRPAEPQSPETPAPLTGLLADLEDDDSVLQLETAELPFYEKGAVLWHLWFRDGENSEAPESDAFAITFDGEAEKTVQVLDWTNGPIYGLNDQKLFRFSKRTDAYLRFFFHLVRGQLGHFVLLEDAAALEERVPWKDEGAGQATIADTKKLMCPHLKPLERRPEQVAGEKWFRGIFLFRNALFRSEVAVTPTGLIRFENEELLLEDLPVHW